MPACHNGDSKSGWCDKLPDITDEMPTVLEICDRRRNLLGVVEYLVHYSNSWLPEDEVCDIIQTDDCEPIVEVLHERVDQGNRKREREMLVSWKNVWLPVEELDLTSQVVRDFIHQHESLAMRRHLLPDVYRFVYKKRRI